MDNRMLFLVATVLLNAVLMVGGLIWQTTTQDTKTSEFDTTVDEP